MLRIYSFVIGVDTAEYLVEDTIKETVSVICICSPCLISITALNKDVVYNRRALTGNSFSDYLFSNVGR